LANDAGIKLEGKIYQARILLNIILENILGSGYDAFTRLFFLVGNIFNECFAFGDFALLF
jgi:hypothetical protein